MPKTRIRRFALAAVFLAASTSLTACAGGGSEYYNGGATDGEITAVVTDTGGRTYQDSTTVTIETRREDGAIRQYYCDSGVYPVCPMLRAGDTVRFSTSGSFMISVVRTTAAPKEASR